MYSVIKAINVCVAYMETSQTKQQFAIIIRPEKTGTGYTKENQKNNQKHNNRNTTWAPYHTLLITENVFFDWITHLKHV